MKKAVESCYEPELVVFDLLNKNRLVSIKCEHLSRGAIMPPPIFIFSNVSNSIYVASATNLNFKFKSNFQEKPSNAHRKLDSH